MKIQALGHVVLKVRNQQRAEAFYNGILGLPIVARYDEMGMTFFSLGNHHDFAVAAVGDDAPGPLDKGVGLAHVAFKIGDELAVLKSAKTELEAAGIAAVAADHGVSKSLYFADPDGNRVELYIDQSDSWRRDPQTVAAYAPLEL
ncbi:catechol 2,3-dioxygenase [Stella humosa]|uniref:Catechol 2,3-dioxygenase n=1 Tax=Stella humosa TaxID=94 RepID=A0A3N1KYG7_9PROT|nr:VOC family protein [Stella humosa]ROP84207.1 catechol 2,3-dioxygenase [Stella humosa]BBK33719.1 glyoxalase [Stella humosa]